MDEKLKQIQKLLDAAEGNLHSARNLMRELLNTDGNPMMNAEEKAKDLNVIEEGKIIEGVYNGESMVGPDGHEYQVPANYASKSKLVEGDVLKLTIADDGSFIYKQIKPIERRKAVGTLVYNDGSYSVTAESKSYRVLQASVTYYKGEPGDQVTLLLPKDHESTWAAIENIIKAAATSDQLSGSEIGEAVKLDSSTPEEVAENVSEEKSESPENNEPEIEFPAESSNEPADLSKEDKAILENLTQNTVPIENEPVEPASQPEVPAPAPESNDENGGSAGIKELEI